jgi:hypothetical protein
VEVESFTLEVTTTVRGGSQGQILATKFDSQDRVLEILQLVRNTSLLKIAGSISYTAGPFTYRIWHEVEAGGHQWSVYDFDRFNEVPLAWIDTINTYRDNEYDELHTIRFQTRRYQVRNRIKDFLNVDRILK